MPMKELVDIEGEIARIEKELQKANADREFFEKKLSNQGFVAKAPAAVIEGEKAKRASYADKLASVEASLEKYKK